MLKRLSLILSLVCCASGSLLMSAGAQIAPDGTTSTTVNSDNNLDFNIEQGDRAGNNLFHSFDDFSVPTNGSAVFNNEPEISNIFSRVTGGNLSNIDGLIQANSANLFLINPAGIMFGNNARLDIGGSFLGTTADSILFEDGVFSATNLDNPPLLTINAPIGLNFRDNPSEIVNSSFAQNDADEFVGLEVEPGNNLSLIGGDINFEAGEVTARGGRVELGGLDSAGTIAIASDGSLTFPAGVARGNVFLTNDADVDVTAEGGGSIAIHANNIEMSGGIFGSSSLTAGISSASTSAEAQSGDINLDATGAIEIRDGSTVFNQVAADGTGNPGNITVNTTDLSLFDGSQITAGVFGTGNAGRVTVNASGDITFQGTSEERFPSGIVNNLASTGIGNAGDIEINAVNLNLTDGAAILSSVLGSGNGGDITINASNAVDLSGFFTNDSGTFLFSRIDSVLERDAVGNAGNIEIAANSFSLSDRASLSSSTFGIGNGGLITISATDSVALDSRANIFSNVGRGAEGNSLGIAINARSLSVEAGSQIQASVVGTNANFIGGIGNAGDVSVDVEQDVLISGSNQDSSLSSAIFNNVESGAVGNAGNIAITANSFTLSDEGLLNNSTFGRGNPGNITLNIADSIDLTNNADIFSEIGVDAEVESETASRVEINAGSFAIADPQSSITTSTSGQGSASNIALNIERQIEIVGGNVSSIVNPTGEGNAGNIDITAGSLSLSDGAFLDNSTLGTGNAGIVSIDASGAVNLNNNVNIFNNVERGAVGNSQGVTINAQSLSVADGSEIQTLVRGSTASNPDFGTGDAGDININVQDNVTFSGSMVDEAGIQSFSQANSILETEAVGSAGNISIQSGSLTVSDGASLSSSTFGEGDAGSVAINTEGAVNLTNDSLIFSNVESGAVGNSLGVTIDAQSLSIDEGAQVQALVRGASGEIPGGLGNAGNVILSADRDVSISGMNEDSGLPSAVFSFVGTGAEGNGGNIEISSSSLTISDSAFLNNSIFGNGNPGNITLNVANAIALTNDGDIFSEVGTNAATEMGTASTIEVNAGSFTISDIESSIETSTSGQGSAGNIIFDLDRQLNIAGGNISSAVNSSAEGNAGNIEIQANSLTLSEEAFLDNSTSGQGNAGNITLNITDATELTASNVFSQIGSTGNGSSGNITLNTGSLSLLNGSQFTTSVFGTGDAGNIDINVDGAFNISGFRFDSVENRNFLSGINSTLVDNTSTGSAGNVDITANSLNLSDGGFISNSTSGQGNAGNTNISVRDRLSIVGSVVIDETNTQFSQIRSQSEIGADGNAGNISIESGSLSISDLAFITTGTSGTGDAGNININTASSVNLDNVAFISSDIDQSGVGAGGEINIQTQNLKLLGGSEILSRTLGNGRAGDITVNATDTVEISGTAPSPFLADGRPGGFSSGLFASSESGAAARGGEITVTTSSLELNEGGVISARSRSLFSGGEITVNANNLAINSGGQILTTAFSDGASGNINLNVSDRLSVEGSDSTFSTRLTTLTSELGAENANIIIDPVNEFSGIFANTAPDSRGNGGIITVSAKDIELDRGGQISAETNFLQPADITPSNINLSVDDTLTLDGNSTISAQAANSANGGNINIDAENGFVIAFPSEGTGNDIRANASAGGAGGQINISAEQIFGLSAARNTSGINNSLNDIDASSEDGTLDGNITIDTSDLSSTRGAARLSVETVEPERTVAQVCSYNQDAGIANTFVVNGKGGVPASPVAPLTSESLSIAGESNANANHTNAIATSQGYITPARGVVKTEDGRIVLTATPTSEATRLSAGSQNCS